MNIKYALKSIRAALAGMLTGIVLSLGTDYILTSTGVLPQSNLWVPAQLIGFVLFYRTAYNVLGSYIIARLAPSHPMRHAIIVGILGTAVSIVGAIATRDMNLGPAWYAWTLAALTLPSAWLGAMLNKHSK